MPLGPAKRVEAGARPEGSAREKDRPRSQILLESQSQVLQGALREHVLSQSMPTVKRQPSLVQHGEIRSHGSRSQQKTRDSENRRQVKSDTRVSPVPVFIYGDMVSSSGGAHIYERWIEMLPWDQPQQPTKQASTGTSIPTTKLDAQAPSHHLSRIAGALIPSLPRVLLLLHRSRTLLRPHLHFLPLVNSSPRQSPLL